MKRTIFILLFFVSLAAFAQEADDYFDDEYLDVGIARELRIYGERPREFASGSIDAYVFNLLNGSILDRKQFIEIDFLEASGFRHSGNARYRKTDGAEKISSILSGIGSMSSFGLIPMKPFFETEYDRLPKGELYKFETVFVKSDFTNVAPGILTLMELEYMLQIEFRNGILLQDYIKYYSDENINKFERLIHGLPDLPESFYQTKNRYFSELKKLRAALERYRNPDENYFRALQNLGDIFNMNGNR
jgi:hypothetical protein